MLVIGGWNAYEGIHAMFNERANFPAFNIPIVCLPASINNNLPGSEFSIGADTALNNIVDAVDKIKQSAVATRRCFVVEVMGHWCGYLALMGALATGAEHFYLPEDGITLHELQEDVNLLKQGFNSGKKLGLVIRNEDANPIYSTSFICSLFEEEGKEAEDKVGKKAKLEMQSLKAGNEKLLAEARAERDRILKDASDASNQMIVERISSKNRVSQKNKIFRVRVNGDLTGDTLHVTDIRM